MDVFMSFITQVTKGNLRRQGLPVPEEDEAPEHRPNTPHVRFNGEDLWEVLTNNKAANHYKARGFFINLAINLTSITIARRRGCWVDRKQQTPTRACIPHAEK